jgi:hypothetical protein
MVEEAHMTHPRLAPVPIYVTPGRIIATTLGITLGVAAVGWGSAYAAWQVAHRVLQNHDKYGPRRA